MAFTEADHPWQTAFPVICSDHRLREVLGVVDPKPGMALRETVEWLWNHRRELDDATR